jgi:hypothetical protein
VSDVAPAAKAALIYLVVHPEVQQCPRTTQATTALNHEQPLEVGDRIEIGGQAGIVRTVQPLLGELELRLVVQLLADRG